MKEIEKVIDFEELSYILKAITPSDIIPLPDGVLTTKDKCYRITIRRIRPPIGLFEDD